MGILSWLALSLISGVVAECVLRRMPSYQKCGFWKTWTHGGVGAIVGQILRILVLGANSLSPSMALLFSCLGSLIFLGAKHQLKRTSREKPTN